MVLLLACLVAEGTTKEKGIIHCIYFTLPSIFLCIPFHYVMFLLKFYCYCAIIGGNKSYFEYFLPPIMYLVSKSSSQNDNDVTISKKWNSVRGGLSYCFCSFSTERFLILDRQVRLVKILNDFATKNNNIFFIFFFKLRCVEESTHRIKNRIRFYFLTKKITILKVSYKKNDYATL